MQRSEKALNTYRYRLPKNHSRIKTRIPYLGHDMLVYLYSSRFTTAFTIGTKFKLVRKMQLNRIKYFSSSTNEPIL